MCVCVVPGETDLQLIITIELHVLMRTWQTLLSKVHHRGSCNYPQFIQCSPLGPFNIAVPHAFYSHLFDVVTKMIDVVTNSTQTTPTHCALNFPGENPVIVPRVSWCIYPRVLLEMNSLCIPPQFLFLYIVLQHYLQSQVSQVYCVLYFMSFFASIRVSFGNLWWLVSWSTVLMLFFMLS